MRTIQKIQALSSVLLLSVVMQVGAVPITGAIGMGGNFIPVDSRWNATGTAAATGIDFNPNYFSVNRATGDFASVGNVGSITDFQFGLGMGINDGSGGIMSVSSIAGFWAIDDFSFELTSVTKGIANDPGRFLILDGTGIISATGFDNTAGTWSFRGDTTNSGTFTWSAGSAAVASVPEPGILALLGMGLVGFAGRKKIIR